MVKKRSLGLSFPEEVAKTTSEAGHFKQVGRPSDWVDFLLPNFQPGQSDEDNKKSTWRVVVFLSIILVLFFVIFIRLFHLQIIQGKQNKALADGNRIQVKMIHAPRGVIFDRNGKILAANSPAFRLIDQDSKENKVRLVSREQALEWEVKNDPRALNLEVDNVRVYPEGEKFAHVVGYMGEISEEQLKNNEYKTYKSGDQIGKSGIEAQYEKFLRGVDGGEIIEVDSKGRKIRTLRQQPPTPGQNLYLSIDASLQEKIF